MMDTGSTVTGGRTHSCRYLPLLTALVAAIVPTARAETAAPGNRPALVIVVGAPGTEDYGRQFRTWAGRWADAAAKADVELIRIGGESTPAGADVSDRERLRQELGKQQADSDAPLWIVLIGHGTYDRELAKFNLRGPDVSARELGQWLPTGTRPVIVINCTSSSSPFINRLSGPRRVVVTATNSGYELNFARFGDFMSQTITDPSADLDKDEQVSVLEAFLAASAAVREFYDRESRLATEHAIVDDNGDGLGTPASWFRGVRATRRPKDKAEADGLRANQFHLIPSARERQLPPELRRKRDQLELEIAALRDSKSRIPEQEYYEKLETLLVPLARLYAQVD